VIPEADESKVDATSDSFLRRMALYELRALSIDREVLERLD
jgi:hypothetical protein